MKMPKYEDEEVTCVELHRKSGDSLLFFAEANNMMNSLAAFIDQVDVAE